MLSPFSIISGLIIGALFGIALQRGRFCMNSAFRDPLVFKDFTLLKAVGLAILVQLVGFYVISMFGFVDLNPKPLYLLAIPLGGYIFGIGMVLAGGCASGTGYRVGEGMIGSVVALLGFVLFSYLAKDGFLANFVAGVQSINLGPVTASSISGIPFGLWVLVISLLILWLLFRDKKFKSDKQDDSVNLINFTQSMFKNGWSWPIAGITIGLIGILAFIFSAMSGRNYPLGITMGIETITKSIIEGRNFLTWESFQVIGLIVGAFIGAKLSGEFKIRTVKFKVGIQSLVGGSLMGFGAIMAGGCNIGHILSGVPQLAVSSIVASIFIILGGWTMSYLLFIRTS